MNKIKVKPAEGLSVRDPQTLQVLPAEGAEVPETTYWLRRIKVGDVVVVTEQKTQPSAKSAVVNKE